MLEIDAVREASGKRVLFALDLLRVVRKDGSTKYETTLSAACCDDTDLYHLAGKFRTNGRI